MIKERVLPKIQKMIESDERYDYIEYKKKKNFE